MKKVTLFLTLFLGVVLVFSFAVVKEKVIYNPEGNPTLVPDEIIVGFYANKASKARADLKKLFNLKVLRHSRKADRFTVFKHSNPQAMLDKIKGLDGVAFAEQNGYVYATWVPNDPYYSYQWHMTRINMEDAWPLSTGSGAVVAINDTGVKQSLQDLAQTSFTAGYDFINNDSDPTDDEGHGSHVCGTVAQSTNNGIGVTGVAYNCTIMPVKVLNSQGSGSYDQVADGVYWATDHGAHIINMSLSGSSGSTTLQNACVYAWNNGVLVVCAAGNSGSSSPEYPAAYSVCMSVSATNYLDQLANYSNYGSTIDISAPGGDGNDYNGDGYIDGVLQNTFSGSSEGYYFYTGTSMAAPHVAGVAALCKAADPTLTNAEIRDILETTAVDLGASGWDQYFGHGMVDAYAAVQEAQGGTIPDTDPPVISNVNAVDITHNSARITWTTDEPSDSVVYYGTTTAYGNTESSAANVTSHSINLTGLQPDTLYHYKVSSTDPSDNTAESGDYTFTTEPQPTEVYMYVYSITMQKFNFWGWLYRAEATITIKDTDGNFVPTATVYVQWSGKTSRSQSGVTNANGQVTFNSGWAWGNGTFTITVTNVTHATLIYDPSLNNETSDSI
jgi:serine protease